MKKQILFLRTKKKQNKTQLKTSVEKLKIAKNSKISDDFFVIARVESFILGKSLNDALNRAINYVKAGADGILIHSKEKTPHQIFEFAKKFKRTKYFCPLVAVPSTYSKVKEKELIKNGFKVVIYANQMLRAAYPSMVNAGKEILKNERAFEIEKKITPIKEIISLIK